MTREIPLTRGMVAIVDEADFPMLSQLTWRALNAGNAFYAATGKKKTCLMHRLLLCPPEGVEVDHVNGNTLDCRRTNIRLASRSGNGANRPKPAGRNGGPTSMFKGVSRSRTAWVASICVEKQQIRLGSFQSEVQAALAYDAAAREHFGSFARPNFPMAQR